MAVMQATRGIVSQGSAKKPSRSIGEAVRRIACVTGVAALVVASLLTFPSSIPWMIAFWLVWHTLAVARGKPGWLPLLTCVAILLVKRIYWAPALVGFAVVACAVAVARAACPKARLWQGKLAWCPVVALWMAWTLATLQWHAIATCSRPAPFDPSRSVVCLGDSLTSGLLPDPGYPAQLQKMIRCPVINLGQSGITSEDGLVRLNRVAALNPPAQLVVIELGGHDFLKGWPRATTKKNLKDAIAFCRSLGAEVLLMEIPRGFMTDPYRGLEREIAHETDVHLVSDSAIRQLVLWSPIAPPGMWLPGSHLSDDGLHTNSRGSEYLARHVARAMQIMYGTELVRSASSRWAETSGEWRVASGEWQVASGKWQVASGKWQVASGEWQDDNAGRALSLNRQADAAPARTRARARNRSFAVVDVESVPPLNSRLSTLNPPDTADFLLLLLLLLLLLRASVHIAAAGWSSSNDLIEIDTL